MDNNNLEHNWNMFQNKKKSKNETLRPLEWDLSDETSRNFILLSYSVDVCEQKSQREEDILVVLSLTTIKYLSLVLKKNGIIQTILQITEIGGSIGTKIKKMVLTPLGRSNISRIPDMSIIF